MRVVTIVERSPVTMRYQRRQTVGYCLLAPLRLVTIVTMADDHAGRRGEVLYRAE